MARARATRKDRMRLDAIYRSCDAERKRKEKEEINRICWDILNAKKREEKKNED